MKGARTAEAALVSNTVVWGATFILVKVALEDISPILFLAIRFSIAAIVLAAIFRPDFRKLRRPAVLLAGVFLFAGYLLQTIGLQYTTAPKSAFITGLTSVMAPLLAALVYRNRPLVAEVAGILMALAGLGLMTLGGPIGSVNRGDLLTVLCAFAFAAYIVAVGHFSEQMSFELLSVVQIVTAAGLGLSMFWWAEKPHLVWRPAVIYAILITGLFATALAFTVQAWAQRYVSATRTALIYMLEPVFAWVTSFVVAGEGLAGRAAAGAALILGGVLLAEMKPWNSRQHPLILGDLPQAYRDAGKHAEE